jgi:DNA-directed RNA polymerase subunit RPC12/RpoP
MPKNKNREGRLMKSTERVSYIRGLAEGLELDADKKEVKVLNAIIDLLDDMALSMSEMEGNINDLSDQLDAVDEDLGSLEDDFYDIDEEPEDEEDDGDDSDDEGDGRGEYEVTCPNCHKTLRLSEDSLQKGEMECPNCGETLEFDLEDEDGDETEEKQEPSGQNSGDGE